MTDEPDDLPEDIEVEDFSEADYVEVEGAMIIAPRGWGWLADTVGAAAIRVNMAKGGSIDVLSSADGVAWKWSDITKLKAPAKLVAINGDRGRQG